MIKRISVMLSIILTFSVLVCSGAEQNTLAFDELVAISIIPAELREVESDRKITRREALEILLIVGEEDTNVTERALNSYKNQEMLQWRYADINDNTKDCSLVAEATMLGLFQREETDNTGERIARMGDAVTWEELLHFSMRILSSGYGMLYERVNEKLIVYENIYPNEHPLLIMAKECGLINLDNVAFTSAIHISEEDLHKSVTWADFSEIVYKMLYIPTAIEGYGGTYDHYRIESFR